MTCRLELPPLLSNFNVQHQGTTTTTENHKRTNKRGNRTETAQTRSEAHKLTAQRTQGNRFEQSLPTTERCCRTCLLVLHRHAGNWGESGKGLSTGVIAGGWELGHETPDRETTGPRPGEQRRRPGRNMQNTSEMNRQLIKQGRKLLSAEDNRTPFISDYGSSGGCWSPASTTPLGEGELF